MDRQQEYQKQKKARETFRKIVINVFIWLLIIAFVSTIGVTWNSDRQNVEIFKVAKVNGRIYDNRPGAAFNYIHSGIRDQLSKSAKGQVDSAELDRLALERSVDILENYAILADFAEKNGVKPSREMLRGVIEALTGRSYSVPSRGLIDYATMEYANAAFTGNQGDVMNAFSPVTLAELYSYFDLVNYSVEGEIAYLDLTNALSSRIGDEELQAFYQSNISRYAGEVTIDEMAVSNKAVAFEIAGFALSNGWDKALTQYKEKISVSTGLILSNVSGLSKRYFLVLTNAPGSLVHKPQFENGVYHVIRVVSFPDLNKLGSVYKRNVMDEYVSKYFTNLRARFSPEIEESVRNLTALAGTSSDLRRVSGFNYVKTGKTSPVNQILRDDKGDRILLPVLSDDHWFDAFFGTGLNQVSAVLRTDGFIGVVKPVYKGVNPSIDYDKIDQEVALRWINFKNYSATKDWVDNLKDSSFTETFNDEIRKIQEKEVEQQN